MFSNRTYDVLKFLALIALPGFATFYFSVGSLWDFPNTPEVVRTIVAAETFLGVLLGLTSKAYNNSDNKYDGEIDVVESDGGKLFSLNLNSNPEELETKREVLFKVNPTNEEL